MASPLFVIDSSPAVQRLVEQASSSNGYEVVGFKDGKSALAAVERIRPTVIIADYHLDSMAFPELCNGFRSNDLCAHTPIIALLSASDRLDEKHLKDLGVKAILKKPLHPDDLLEAIKKVRRTAPREAPTQQESSQAPAEQVPVHKDEPAQEPAPELSAASPPPSPEPKKPAVQLRADPGLNVPPPEEPPPTETLVTRVMEPPSAKATSPPEPPPSPEPLTATPPDSQPASEAKAEAPLKFEFKAPASPGPEASDNPQLSEEVASVESPQERADPAEKPPSASAFQLAPEPMTEPDSKPMPKPDPEPSVKADSSAGDPMQGLVSRLLEATAMRVDQTLTEQLQTLVALEVQTQIAKGAGTPSAQPQGESLSREQISDLVQETAHKKIPDLVTQHLADMELTLQQNLQNTVTTLVGELSEKLRQSSPEDEVRKQLPDLLKEPGGAMDQLVKEAVEEALARHLRPVAEEMFRDVGREVAQEVIASTVQDIVPSLAEAEIKKEIERLSSSA